MLYISELELLKFCKRMIEFPFLQICKHYVVGELLDLMERNGKIPNENFCNLVKNIVEANDDQSIEIMEKMINSKFE